MPRATVSQLNVGVERSAPATMALGSMAGAPSEIQLKGYARWIAAAAAGTGDAGTAATGGVSATGGAAGRIRRFNTDDGAVGVED